MEERLVYETVDYGQFHLLKGNRFLDPRRVEMLKKSIKEYGYIGAPIVVNENDEVIDGQHRLTACRELRVPVRYIRVRGLGLDHCRTLNINAKNWSLLDYCLSYAARGNENYERLFEILPVDAGKIFGLTFVRCICSYAGAKGTGCDDIKAGRLILGAGVAARAKYAYRFVENHQHEIMSVRGRRDKFAQAIAFAIIKGGCDAGRMESVLEDRLYVVGTVGNMNDAIEDVERLYNFNLRINGVELARIWKDWQKAKNRRYNA